MAEPAASFTAHASLLTGRFPGAEQPSSSSATLENALSPQEASQLKARPGSTLMAQFTYVQIPTEHVLRNVTLRVVGVFSPRVDPSYWQGATFR
ncbi:hypothetical protein [Thermogemmatispora sp.]|uniref:hypothetical protein n=1 Tax=Thermogemmatispora sp. TaxID=1968838 RepID=UPI0035E40F4F